MTGCLSRLVAAVLLMATLVPIAGYMDSPDMTAVPAVAPTPSPTPSPRPKREVVSRRPTENREEGQAPRRRARHHEIGGRASWHATGRDGLYAAACRPLRRAMGKGNWRGRRVLVANGRRAVEVVLNDWCGSRDKTIDLSDEAFRFFAPLSRGVIRVTVGW